MTVGAGDLLRAFHWRLRSNRADAVHMLALPGSVLGSALRLPVRLRRAGAHRPRLAIVLLERMGDIVAAEPIARLARQRFPDAWICWIVQAPYASLPRSYPAVDDVVTVRCLTEWLLLQRLNLFDVVWNLHLNDACCPHCCIPRNEPGALPTLATYFEHGSLLAVHCLCAGLPPLDESPVLAPPPAAVAAVDALALPRRFIAIHGVSTDPRREWVTDKWRVLVDRLLAADPAASVVEVGTQPLVIRQDGARQRALCGGLSMLETAEVIRRAALHVGIDSGPAHLAHAVGTPGVLLLGRYANFRRYMPFSGDYGSGRRATVLQADGWAAELTTDAVFAAVQARLGAA